MLNSFTDFSRKQAVNELSNASTQNNSSFQAFGFGASPSGNSSSQDPNISRRGSRVNISIAPSAALDTQAPEIRKYKKRF
jgi:hypothetical protein